VSRVLGSIFENEVVVGMIRLPGAQNGEEAAGKDTHEMTESDVMALAFGAFALVKSFQLGIVLSGAEGGSD
jgi:hypothetical protein